MQRCLMRALAIAAALGLAITSSDNRANAAQSSIDSKATELVAQFAEQLATARSTAVKVTSTLTILSAGQIQTLASHFDIDAERPDKLAIRHTDGLYGSTIVSDGQTLAVYQADTDEITTAPAPASIQEIASVRDVQRATEFNMILCSPGLFGDAPYDNIMDGVTTGSYVGMEQVNDQQCHRLNFEQSQFQWAAWFTTATPPLLVKAEIQRNRSRNNSGQPVVQDVESTLTIEFADWQFNDPVPSTAFDVSSLTGNATSIASLGSQSAAGLPFETPIASRSGQPAPDFQLPLLNGEDVEKGHLLGKVVVLDFWATWCGPCLQIAPIFPVLEKHFKDEPVQVISVNYREQPAAIKKFLRSQNLELNVALDSDGSISKSFGVQALPTVVVLGKDGKIRYTHQGVSSGLKDTLTSQVEILLQEQSALPSEFDPKNLQDADVESTVAESQSKPTRLWRVYGQWKDIAYDADRNVIIAASRHGASSEFDPGGNPLRDLDLDGAGSNIRLSQLTDSAAREIVTFTPWHTDLKASDMDGVNLWTFPDAFAINDVACYDLTGDGADEVIVSFNGSFGLYALSPDGKILWKNEKLRNVWNCCAGQLSPDGEAKVLSTSSIGRIHILNAAGVLEDEIAPEFYATMVRFGRIDSGSVVLSSGRATGMLLMAAHRPDKSKLWQVLVKTGDSHLDSMVISDCGAYIAVAVTGGEILIFETATGNRLTTLDSQSDSPQCAWSVNPTGGIPQLLVTTGHSLTAYQL